MHKNKYLLPDLGEAEFPRFRVDKIMEIELQCQEILFSIVTAASPDNLSWDMDILTYLDNASVFSNADVGSRLTFSS